MTDERSSRRPHKYHSRSDEKEQKKINIDQVVAYLSHAFARAQAKAAQQIGYRNVQGTKLYTYQVDFCYLIDEIQRGPVYILPKIIQDANQLILALDHETRIPDEPPPEE